MVVGADQGPGPPLHPRHPVPLPPHARWPRWPAPCMAPRPPSWAPYPAQRLDEFTRNCEAIAARMAREDGVAAAVALIEAAAAGADGDGRAPPPRGAAPQLALHGCCDGQAAGEVGLWAA